MENKIVLYDRVISPSHGVTDIKIFNFIRGRINFIKRKLFNYSNEQLPHDAKSFIENIEYIVLKSLKGK